MTITTIKGALQRIEVAPQGSPIAVFHSDRPGMVDAVFADTIAVRMRIDRQDPALIGLYDETSKPLSVECELARALLNGELLKQGMGG